MEVVKAFHVSSPKSTERRKLMLVQRVNIKSGVVEVVEEMSRGEALSKAIESLEYFATVVAPQYRGYPNEAFRQKRISETYEAIRVLRNIPLEEK